MPELRDAPQTHHKACDGTQCELFGCVTLADLLDTLKNADCTFWACEGPDSPPENMVTCGIHWAYHDLKGIVV
jgi:hypothetical protein